MEKLEIYPREDRPLFWEGLQTILKLKMTCIHWIFQADTCYCSLHPAEGLRPKAHWSSRLLLLPSSSVPIGAEVLFHIWDGNILTCVLINFMNILSHDINALTPVSYSIPFPFAPKWRQFFCNCQYSKNTYITAFCSRTSIGPVPSGISYF